MRHNKIAFLVHDPIMLVHYADVWKDLGSANFTIVLTGVFYFDLDGNEKRGLSDFVQHVRAAGYSVKAIDEIIGMGEKFEYVVTNHFLSGSSVHVKIDSPFIYLKKRLNRWLRLVGKGPAWRFAVDENTYLPLQIGTKQIRFMYGADIGDGWSLKSWNTIYDIFFCHGINDEREIKKRFKGKTYVMGYPRYDRFFSKEIDLPSIKLQFGIDESKQTILWLPTLGGENSSIPLFAENLAKLGRKFNLIVRPHPFSFTQEKHYINILEKFEFNIDRDALRDMNALYSVSDVVLADNGGSPFSAIFLGKALVFLRVPVDAGSNSASAALFADTSVMELKNYLPVIDSHNISQLEEILNSSELLAKNVELVDVLYKKYFDSPRGGGAKRVADILRRL